MLEFAHKKSSFEKENAEASTSPKERLCSYIIFTLQASGA